MGTTLLKTIKGVYGINNVTQILTTISYVKENLHNFQRSRKHMKLTLHANQSA